MNYSVTILEMAVVALGLGLLLLDLWTPLGMKRQLGYAAAAALGFVLLFSFSSFIDTGATVAAFKEMYVQDALALFFKRFFLVAAIIVLIVSVELITVTFYVLTSFQRSRLASLEAGVKYLILGALASAFLVFGIALVFGTTGQMNFSELASVAPQFSANKIFLLGLLLALAGLGFKIAAFPLQIWAPDVYQGSPAPTTAFLAVGSKAAGFALLLRVLFSAVPDITAHWTKLLMTISAITILYGNLCAIPQRNLKRLLGYSSISHAGYLLLGVAAMSPAGQSAVLYYLGGYLFTVLATFTVIALVMRQVDGEDISLLGGLNQRSPFLAATLTLAMVSLAGIPPLAGFFGKFLLLKAAVEQGSANHAYYWLVGVAIVGVVISLYYYFGVVRAIYWSKDAADLSPIPISQPIKASLWCCILGMLWLGLFPNHVINTADSAVAGLKTPPMATGIPVARKH